MNETTLQFFAILVTVAGLLGWVLKKVILYFIKAAEERMKYIESLVSQNQKNVENFTDTVNHQRTLDRAMQEKHFAVLQELKTEIQISNKVTNRALDHLTQKKNT